jgi:hypothetical protein
MSVTHMIHKNWHELVKGTCGQILTINDAAFLWDKIDFLKRKAEIK